MLDHHLCLLGRCSGSLHASLAMCRSLCIQPALQLSPVNLSDATTQQQNGFARHLQACQVASRSTVANFDFGKVSATSCRRTP